MGTLPTATCRALLPEAAGSQRRTCYGLAPPEAVHRPQLQARLLPPSRLRPRGTARRAACGSWCAVGALGRAEAPEQEPVRAERLLYAVQLAKQDVSIIQLKVPCVTGKADSWRLSSGEQAQRKLLK
jgi:hypothetical protein